MGGKKKKKTKKSRATRVSQPTPASELLPVEEQQELLPMVPPLLEPYPMMPMAAPTMVETVQMVPTATPMMVETAVPTIQPTMMETPVPMMQTAAPAAFSAMPTMQMGAPAVSAMPMMGNAMSAQAFPATAMQGIGGFGTQAW
jgi:hypothetical protein